jgi:hypothetical protein
MSNNEKSISNNEKPVHTIRVGVIEVAIWRREGENGPFYSVSSKRSYKDGDQWKQADSYGLDDCLLLSKLLDQAHTWCILNPPAKRQAAA